MPKRTEEFFFLEAMLLAEGQSLDIADPDRWLEGWHGRPLTLEGACKALRHFEESYRSRGYRVLRDRRPERQLPGMAVSLGGEGRIVIGCRSEIFSGAELDKARNRQAGGAANYIVRVMRRLFDEKLPVQAPEEFLGDAVGKILSLSEAEAAFGVVLQAYRDVYTLETETDGSDGEKVAEFRMDRDQSLIFSLRKLDPDPSDFGDTEVS